MNRYVHTVTEDNFYMDYDVKVQAKNIMGRGPPSPEVTIKSAEDGMFLHVVLELSLYPFK